MSWAKIISGLVSLFNTVAKWFADEKIRKQGFNQAVLEQYKREEAFRNEAKKLKDDISAMSDSELDQLRNDQRKYFDKT